MPVNLAKEYSDFNSSKYVNEEAPVSEINIMTPLGRQES